MLRPLCVCWAYASGTEAQAEHMCKALVRMLSICVRNWSVCSAYTSVFPFFHFFPLHLPPSLHRASVAPPAAMLSGLEGNFDRSGQYNQAVRYERDATHKSRAAWAFRSLEVYMSERQHIYMDLNESSSARPGGSQQLEILPSPNSKRTPNFSAQILARRRNFT
jgi:hypothetical protein